MSKDASHHIRKRKNKTGIMLFMIPVLFAMFGTWHWYSKPRLNIFEHECVTMAEIQDTVGKNLSTRMSRAEVEKWLHYNNIQSTTKQGQIECLIYTDPEWFELQRNKNSLRPYLYQLKELVHPTPKVAIMCVFMPTYKLNLSFDKRTDKYSGACIQKRVVSFYYSSC